MNKTIDMKCRKCGVKNPFSFYAPVFNTCICYKCVEKRNWIDPITGNLKKGITL